MVFNPHTLQPSGSDREILLMADQPQSKPLGARPVLPVPEGEPARRAREMFSAYLADARSQQRRERSEASASGLQNPPRSGTAPHGAPSYGAPSYGAPPPADRAADTNPRRYDRALAILGGHALPEVNPPVDPAVASDVGSEPEPTLTPRYPPLGSPAVRPSAPARPAPTPVDQSLLEGMAENALVLHGPDGAASFEISFHDDVFSDLACCVSVEDGQVVATFRVCDVNTRRLLEAESGRLRSQLEERGLKVRAVRVVTQ